MRSFVDTVVSSTMDLMVSLFLFLRGRLIFLKGFMAAKLINANRYSSISNNHANGDR